MNPASHGIPTVLRALLHIPGVSGYESPVVEYLRSLLPEDVPTHTDPIGNLTASFGSGSPHLLLIVHTDEVGFVVSGIRPDGALYLTAVGHWDLAALGGTQVDVHAAEASHPGVVITVPPHLDRGLSGPGAWLDGNQIVVDVGTDCKAQTEELGIRVLDSVTLARYTTVLPGGPYVARGLDNRVGCYLLLELAHHLATTPPSRGRVTLAWASQEEVGFRGPRALAHEGSFDAVLAIDAYPAERRPGARSPSDTARLGYGPVLRGADLAGVGSTRFLRGLERQAHECELPVQLAYAHGHNQASVFVGSYAAALDLPIAYLHSGVECVHPCDIDTVAALLRGIVTHPNPEALWS